jgi:hypothetical protein
MNVNTSPTTTPNLIVGRAIRAHLPMGDPSDFASNTLSMDRKTMDDHRRARSLTRRRKAASPWSAVPFITVAVRGACPVRANVVASLVGDGPCRILCAGPSMRYK